MTFSLFKPRHKELSPRQLDSMLAAGTAQVIDVREPDEFSAGHIPGAINLPLSGFRASALPEFPGKVLVLNCAAGRRSAMALDKCAAARAEVDTHLAGGFGAWRAAGLPVAQ